MNNSLLDFQKEFRFSVSYCGGKPSEMFAEKTHLSAEEENFVRNKLEKIVVNNGLDPDEEEFLVEHDVYGFGPYKVPDTKTCLFLSKKFLSLAKDSKCIKTLNQKWKEEWIISLAQYFQNRVDNVLYYRNKPTNSQLLVKKSDNGFVYLIKDDIYYKIGRAKSPKDRERTYRTENPRPIEVLFCEKVDNYVEVEKELLKVMAPKNHRGEWFFLEDSDIEIIKHIVSAHAIS